MWDTCTLLWYLDRNPDPPNISLHTKAFNDICRKHTAEMIQEAKSKQILIVVSAMALAEMAMPDGSRPKKDQEQVISDFLKNSWIYRIAITERVAKRARTLRRDMPKVILFNEDMVQVATAAEYNLDEFVTCDGEWADPVRRNRRQKKGILKYDDLIPLADGTRKLRIWSPVERHEARERRLREEERKESPLYIPPA